MKTPIKMLYTKRAIMAICILSFCCQFNFANAQKLFFVFAHAAYEQPYNHGLMSQYKFGLGGEAGAGVKLLGKTYATGTVGYSNFFDKNGGPGTLTYVPVRFGLRQNFLPLNILYLHADVGTAGVKNNSTSGSRFTGSFGGGVKLGPLDAQIDYELIGKKNTDPAGSNGWVAFKLGWRFGL
ncbi:hypothetical protein [Arachidicoccus sp.]|jgi:hypothetical protein|uniref:hypothetical protein n=1 Tax=Arachidicoccus sp. TaxID=1872624 RepID=UPI003D256E7C